MRAFYKILSLIFWTGFAVASFAPEPTPCPYDSVIANLQVEERFHKPKYGGIDRAKLEEWVQAHPESVREDARKVAEHFRYIDAAEFQRALHTTLDSYMEKRGAVSDHYLLLNEEGGSGAGIAKMALRHFGAKYPKARFHILSGKTAIDRANNGEVKDFVIVDDASYTGGQVVIKLAHIQKESKNKLNFHILVPYFTPYAIENIPLGYKLSQEFIKSGVQQGLPGYRPGYGPLDTQFYAREILPTISDVKGLSPEYVKAVCYRPTGCALNYFPWTVPDGTSSPSFRHPDRSSHNPILLRGAVFPGYHPDPTKPIQEISFISNPNE